MIITVIVSVSAAMAVSMGLNRFLIKYAVNLGLMDLPDARRVHTTPIPRAGGIALWISFMLTVYTLSRLQPVIFEGFHLTWFTPFTIASVILLGVGIVDDRRGVSAKWKLLGQVLAATVFYALLPADSGSVFTFQTGFWANGIIFVGWSVMLINAFNLIDGLDGLCGGLALIALVALGTMSAINGYMGPMVVLFIMAGCLLGFLVYNRNPARIFLGDTGSMLLGFFIAASATQSTGRRAIVGVILLPIAVAGVPLLDVLLALWRRSARNLINNWTGGSSVGLFSPDKDHLHHRLLATGAGQKKTTRILHGLALILSVLAFMPMVFGEKILGLTVVGFLVLALAGLRHFANIELVHSGSVLHLAVKRPREHRRVRTAVFLYDCMALVFSSVLALWVETNSLSRDFDPEFSLRFTTAFTAFGILSLLYIRAYRRSWSRATIRDVLGIQAALCGAGILAICAVVWLELDATYNILRTGLLAVLFAILAIQLPKCGVELVREFAVDAGHGKSAHRAGVDQPVVILGAGDLGNLFLEYLKTSSQKNFSEFRVVGFLDQNPRLHHRIIRGFPVMGALEDLQQILATQQLHGVIVAVSNMTLHSKSLLASIVVQHNLTVYSWSFDLTPVKASVSPQGLVPSLITAPTPRGRRTTEGGDCEVANLA